MGLLAEAGAVGFTDGTQAVADAQVMRRALAYARAFGRAVIQHPEEPSLAQNGCMNQGEIATRLGLAGISPMAEVIMIERDLRLVEITNGRYHVAHVSTAAGDRCDPPRQGARPAGHRRHRPALFRAQRDRRRATTAPSPRSRRRCAARKTARP